MRKSSWVILWAVAIASRIGAALLFPNAEQDGYSYVERIARYSANLTSGNFKLTDLFDFWLPLFPFVSGLANVFVGDALLTGKLISASCGAVSCVLVFAITLKLTGHQRIAWMTFAFVLLNPLHLMYSAASMTDIPFGCLILASLWFALDNRWIGAAVFAAVAESLRIEAWIFIPLLPVLQWFREKRFSPATLGILVFPIAAWIAIGYFATGNPLGYFAIRDQYQAAYLDFYPTRRGFNFADILRDADYFLIGATGIVFFGSVAAVALLVFRRGARAVWMPAVTAAYVFSILGFILFAYVTKRQPVLFPRYGLFFLVLGLPLLAWVLHFLAGVLRPSWLPKVVVALVIAFYLRQASQQLSIFGKVRQDFKAHQNIASAVASELAGAPGSRCFSDDVGVRVLSGLPIERFVHSGTVPPGVAQQADSFRGYLRDQHVGSLVFVRTENSPPVKFFPELGQDRQDAGDFQFVAVEPSSFGPDVWLYRIREEN